MSGSTSAQTAGAIQARRQHSEKLLARVQDALTTMRKERAPVTVRAVERRAGVSRAFLYQNATARQLVAEAVAQAEGRQGRSRQETVDAVEASWRERALNAEDALRQAVAEIQAHRRHIGELMGRIRDLELDLPADAVRRLTTENTTLKQQLRTLTADHHTLTNRLAAARDNNRSQDRKIAELQARLLEHQPPAPLRHLRPLQG
ncbi:DUF6262 family protein [Streptomyces lavendulae]|uniref:Uncharacterized protein n=1 Tax=Streptomyces lavendulae subsp. lavendulae TaxID=58340 RepID=A0A2K8PR05_STRLA|nr:DUF6262 family protein [Streptomyces lavendulae]ATZ29171.1 hypothetical protein SLAV_37030 [Streptomyces lavendulae subsp. lavendulae]QUQ58987.1 hypothetical protein SLLC_35190 [Streptomyces lavendulae subsp. lavendulae]